MSRAPSPSTSKASGRRRTPTTSRVCPPPASNRAARRRASRAAPTAACPPTRRRGRRTAACRPTLWTWWARSPSRARAPRHPIARLVGRLPRRFYGGARHARRPRPSDRDRTVDAARPDHDAGPDAADLVSGAVDADVRPRRDVARRESRHGTLRLRPSIGAANWQGTPAEPFGRQAALVRRRRPQRRRRNDPSRRERRLPQAPLSSKRTRPREGSHRRARTRRSRSPARRTRSSSRWTAAAARATPSSTTLAPSPARSTTTARSRTAIQDRGLNASNRRAEAAVVVVSFITCLLRPALADTCQKTGQK